MGWGEDLFEALLVGLAFKLATRNMTAEEIDRFFRSAPPALPPPRPVYRLLQPPQLPAPAANLGPPAVPDAPKNPMAVEGSWKEFQDALAKLDPTAQPSQTKREIEQKQLAYAAQTWLRCVTHPCVVVILGKLGSGKSSLAYWLLELLRARAPVYVVGLPDAALKLLPDWIGSVATLDRLPQDCIALIDEAGLQFPARDSGARRKSKLIETLNLSRHRGQTLIFVSKEGRQIDREIMSAASVLILRQPSAFQARYERKEVQDIVDAAMKAFAGLKDDPKKYAYAFAREAEFAGMLRIYLPSFWSEELSRAFRQYVASTNADMTAKMLTREEKIRKAKEMRASGYSLRQIGQTLGVCAATALNYLREAH